MNEVSQTKWEWRPRNVNVVRWFFVYSFLGFVLEVVFARITRANKQDRKCFWLLPLCPVYGLGALAILALPGAVQAEPVLLLVCGGAAATGVEYLTAAFYERVLGVAFWDYSGLPGNWAGRVCPQFSLFWGILAVLLVKRIHPAVVGVVAEVPDGLTASAAVLLAADGLYTAMLLRATRCTASLRWYDRIQKPAAG